MIIKYTDNETMQAARETISVVLMAKFNKFREDVAGMSDDEFGKKYGIVIRDEFKAKHTKATLSNMNFFRQNVYGGGYVDAWESLGINRQTVWALVREGFLSEETRTANSRSKTFYFIPQRTAAEILKANK